MDTLFEILGVFFCRDPLRPLSAAGFRSAAPPCAEKEKPVRRGPTGGIAAVPPDPDERNRVMKITKLTLYPVPPRWMFLKIETDEGVSG